MTTSTSLPQSEPGGARLVSRVWVQVTALVLLCGLAILGFLGYRGYTADPPIAAQAVTPSGQVVYTGADVTAGQELFLRNGLMEYGSIFGHGAYLGPDFTADYLHRAAEIATREYGGDISGSARDKVIADSKYVSGKRSCPGFTAWFGGQSPGHHPDHGPLDPGLGVLG